MGFYSMERGMSHRMKKIGLRGWVSGLAITLTALVSLFAFWRLSPGITFVVAVCSTIALVAFIWREGRD